MTGTRRFPWGLAVAIGATWIGLAATYRGDAVAPPGSSAGWWDVMCGVQLPALGTEGRYVVAKATLPRIDSLQYYQYRHHHGVWLRRVPVAELLRDTGAVFAELARPDRDTTADCWDCVEEQYRRGTKRRAACRATLPAIARPMDVAALDAWRTAVDTASTAPAYRDDREVDFRARMTRGKLVWLTLLFEGLFLSGFWIFLARALPSRSPKHWRRYLGLAPFVLYLPYFLGYAPLVFSFGPSGGFFYPVVLKLVGLPMMFIPCTPLDEWAMYLFPQVLYGLNQIPGDPLAISFMGCVGPVSSLLAGGLLVLAFSGIARLKQKLRQASPSS